MINLTREQILAEPAGRRLDAWVAEYVMGFRRETVNPDGNGEHGGTDVLVPPGIDHSQFNYPPKGRIALGYFVPRYSAAIEAAWPIWLLATRDLFSRRKRFFTTLQDIASTSEFRVVWPDVLAVLDDRLPEAICKARLLATPNLQPWPGNES